MNSTHGQLQSIADKKHFVIQSAATNDVELKQSDSHPYADSVKGSHKPFIPETKGYNDKDFNKAPINECETKGYNDKDFNKVPINVCEPEDYDDYWQTEQEAVIYTVTAMDLESDIDGLANKTSY